MSKHSNWSKPSRDFRIELHPSRQLAAALVVVGALAALGWGLTDAPAPGALAAAVLTLAWTLRLARAEARREVVAIAVGGNGAVLVDGCAVDWFTVSWRGSLWSLAWRSQGRTRRRLGFPDALDAGARRELRLWALARRERATAPAVAP